MTDANRDARRKRASSAVGHYASLWVPGDSSVTPTTITDQRKSHCREIAAKKRAELLAEIKSLTGKEYSGYGERYDSVIRRWHGVKGHGSD